MSAGSGSTGPISWFADGSLVAVSSPGREESMGVSFYKGTNPIMGTPH